MIATERGVRRLVAVDEAAIALGLFIGQTAADAAALAPDLRTADADPDADLAALGALCDWCARFSPAVAVDPPEGLFIDITGVAHLWGSEATLVADLVARLGASGLPARAAVAGAPGAAWALAHFGAPGMILAPGEEAATLGPLPIGALRCEPAVTAQLARLGLGAIGALMRLPRDQITRRFGAQVILRLDQALGCAAEALVFRRPREPWFVRRAFPEPISVPEDLARATADIAVMMCARLETRDQGARCFDLAFHGVDGRARVLSVRLSLAARDPGAITRLFTSRLESVDPGFGIEVVTLTARETASLGACQRRWDAAGEVFSQQDIAPLIDRLVGRLGEDAIWRAAPFPSHLPEQASVSVPPLAPAKDAAAWEGKPRRPSRLFKHPEPVEVVAPAPDDPPLFFRWRGAAHRVRLAEGPERLAAEWWRAPFEDGAEIEARDYYQVEDEAGARFWLFRAGAYSAERPARWWLHGLF